MNSTHVHTPAPAAAPLPPRTKGQIALRVLALWLLPPLGALWAWRSKRLTKGAKLAVTVLAAVWLLILIGASGDSKAEQNSKPPGPVSSAPAEPTAPTTPPGGTTPPAAHHPARPGRARTRRHRAARRTQPGADHRAPAARARPGRAQPGRAQHPRRRPGSAEAAGPGDQAAGDHPEAPHQRAGTHHPGPGGGLLQELRRREAAGAAPLHRGDPGYRAGLDADGDGVACER